LFEGKSILLFGENGTGKSSFVDAVERLFTGRVSILDGRAAGLSAERHGPHIRADKYPTKISVTFDDKSVFDLQTDSISLPLEVQRYLEAARQNVYILRRHQLLEFVESKPRDRYDLLRPFLPLNEFEKVEETIRKAHEILANKLDGIRQTEFRLKQDLVRILGAEASSSDPTVLTNLVNRQLEAVGQTPIDHLSSLSLRVEALGHSLVSYGDISRQTALSSTLAALGSTLEAIGRIDVSPLLRAVVALRERELHEAHVFYENVLTEGARWIRESNRRTCPLCDQSIDPQTVVARVEERLVAMQELVNLRRSVSQQSSALKAGVKEAEEDIRRLQRMSATIAGSDRQVAEQEAVRLLNAMEQLGQSLASDSRTFDVTRIQSAAAVLNPNASLLRQAGMTRDNLVRRLAEISVPKAAQKVLEVHDKLATLQDLWPSVLTSQASLGAAQATVGLAQRIVETAQTARKGEVQAIFDDLSTDLNGLYSKLHPEESHGNIRLEVREAVQQSVTIRADFHEEAGEDPRAYYSEAHLDTLGISIFLALRRWYRQQNPECDLLILDDVLSSVDAAHAVRLAELLLSEFDRYQMLLTTHDRIWFEHLRDIQSRCGVAQNFVNKVIHKWTIDEGPDLQEPEDERRALDRLIEDGSGKDIAVTAGRLLEHLLQEMRYSLRLSVKAKRGELYEIGDLWPALYSTVKRDYPTLYSRGRKALDALDVRWPVRNWIGAHWNTWAGNVSRTTAIDFAKAVREVFDLVYCDKCRRFVMPSATPLGQLACRCGERIYPAPGKAPVQPKSREDLIRTTQGALRDASLDTAKYFEAKRADRQREG